MVFNLGGGSTEETRLLWRLAGMGFQFGTEIIAGVLLGWLADRTFGTAPWGVLIGSILGILVAMTDFTRKAWRLNREMDRTEASRKRPLPPALTDDEEDLTQKQWNEQRDSELEPNPNDDTR